MRLVALFWLAVPLCAEIVLTSGGNELRLDERTGGIAGFGPKGHLAKLDASCVADPPPAPVINSQSEGRQHFRYTDPRSGSEIEIIYAAAGDTGVFTREMVVGVPKPGAVTPETSLCWELPGGAYDLTYLWGGWGQERQVATEALGAGRRVFVSSRGRSTSLYSPWFALHNRTTGVRYAAQLAWSGNWEMGFERLPTSGDKRIEGEPLKAWLGMRTVYGHEARPERALRLPLVAFTATTGDLDDAANNLHRYQREFVLPKNSPNSPPIVHFNSWYPYQGNLTVVEMKALADQAAKLGAEAFVLDSGWYNEKDWSRELGDYVPTKKAFPNGLEELAIHVRSRGMKFGIWTEIENLGIDSQTFKQHGQEWCLAFNGKPVIEGARCMLNFAREDVRNWARGVVDRLVRDYGIEWIKIDYNIDIGNRFDSPSGLALFDHVQAYYAWLDALRAEYPKLTIENCSSGGLRLDLGIIGHTHTTWLSDEVKPVQSLQLGYGCTVEFTPEVCNHWMVGEDHSGKLDYSKGAGWFDFLLRVPMNGQFGISSRVYEWPPELFERATAAVRDYKRIREVIAGADVYHLTPPPDHLNPKGWMAVQYVKGGRSVVLAYRLPDGPERMTFNVRGQSKPIEVRLDQPWRAAIVEFNIPGR